MKVSALLSYASTLILLTIATSMARQTTGTAGSPAATATIDGHYLPPPQQPFQGEINLNAAQSKPRGGRDNTAKGRRRGEAHIASPVRPGSDDATSALGPLREVTHAYGIHSLS